MSKQAMREEAERLMREAMERKSVAVTQGETRIETTCKKCGAPNRVKAPKGETRVPFACKECGVKQVTLQSFLKLCRIGKSGPCSFSVNRTRQ